MRGKSDRTIEFLRSSLTGHVSIGVSPCSFVDWLTPCSSAKAWSLDKQSKGDDGRLLQIVNSVSRRDWSPASHKQSHDFAETCLARCKC